MLCVCTAGLTHIITMDLHQKEIQGFFNFPVDNLRASPFLIQYIQEEVRLLYTVGSTRCASSSNIHTNSVLLLCING